MEGVIGSFRVGILVRKAGFTADAPVSAAAPSLPVPQCLMMAGSRLRVWRSLRLVMALEAGDEQEKTLFRSP